MCFFRFLWGITTRTLAGSPNYVVSRVAHSQDRGHNVGERIATLWESTKSHGSTPSVITFYGVCYYYGHCCMFLGLHHFWVFGHVWDSMLCLCIFLGYYAKAWRFGEVLSVQRLNTDSPDSSFVALFILLFCHCVSEFILLERFNLNEILLIFTLSHILGYDKSLKISVF